MGIAVLKRGNKVSGPTMADVAKRAGVALSTVSHTLSGKRPISAEVRQRVLQAIEELSYQPHALARALATKQTRTIALLYPSLTSSLTEPHLEFVSGVLRSASLRKYGLLLWTTPEGDLEVLSLLRQGLVDGLVLMEVRLDDPRVQVLREQHYPFTMIGHGAENEGISFVDLDFAYAIHTCVDYLANLGHRHLAFLSHSSKLFDLGTGYMVRSEAAFRQALAERGLEGNTRFCETNAQAGYEAMQALLDLDPAPTALIVLNAWVGGGLIRAVQDRGLRIPENISLVGILSPHVAEMTVPPLTAIDFPYETMGYTGTELLLRQLEGETLSIQELLRPSLTIRQSSGPCPY
jgi:DNA-binding LacI/PurR family transcriptional regulator